MVKRRSVKTIEAKLLVDLRQFDAGLAKAAKTLKDTGNNLVSLGNKLSTRLTLPFAAAGAAAVKMAGDVEIAQRRFDTVFANSASEVREFSQDLARSTGSSVFALQRLLSNAQDLTTGLGATTSEGAELSKEIVKLGVDLASFGNVAPTRAVTALTKALTGETESLKLLGVVIKATDINNEILRQGLAATAEEATNTDRAFAILSLAQRQSANATGAASLNMDSLNGAIRGITSAARDATIEFGQVFLPSVKQLAERMRALVRLFQELDEETKTAIVRFGAIAAVIGPGVIALGLMVGALGNLAPLLIGGSRLLFTAAKAAAAFAIPVALVALKTLAAGAALGLLLVTLRGIGVLLETAFDPNVLKPLTDGFANLRDFIVETFTKVGVFLKKVFTGQITSIADVKRELADITTPEFKGFNFDKAGAKFKQTLESNFNEAVDQFKGGFDNLVTNFKRTGQELKGALVPDSLTNLISSIEGRVDKVRQDIADARLRVARDRAFIFGVDTPDPGKRSNNILGQLGASPLFKQTGLGVTAPLLPEGAPDSILPKKEELERTLTLTDKLRESFSRFTDVGRIATDLVTNSIENLANGITDAIFEAKSLGDAFKEVFQSILREISAAIIKMTIFRAVSSVVGGAGGLLGSLAGGATTGKQSGGFIPEGGFARVGEAGVELVSGPVNVTPSSKLNQLGGDLIIQNINNSSQPINMRQEEDVSNGRRVIKTIVEDVVMQDLRRNGNITRAMTNNLVTRKRSN